MLELLILLIVLILFSTLILTTPLRQLLPDNISSDFRKEAVRHALVIDSLTEEVTVRQAYINTLRDLVAGNIAITDSIFYSDSIIVKEHDEPLLDKSQTEKEFCEEFEEEERYNISATTNNPNNNIKTNNKTKKIIIILNNNPFLFCFRFLIGGTKYCNLNFPTLW